MYVVLRDSENEASLALECVRVLGEKLKVPHTTNGNALLLVVDGEKTFKVTQPLACVRVLLRISGSYYGKNALEMAEVDELLDEYVVKEKKIPESAPMWMKEAEERSETRKKQLEVLNKLSALERRVESLKEGGGTNKGVDENFKSNWNYSEQTERVKKALDALNIKYKVRESARKRDELK